MDRKRGDAKVHVILTYDEVVHMPVLANKTPRTQGPWGTQNWHARLEGSGQSTGGVPWDVGVISLNYLTHCGRVLCYGSGRLTRWLRVGPHGLKAVVPAISEGTRDHCLPPLSALISRSSARY